MFYNGIWEGKDIKRSNELMDKDFVLNFIQKLSKFKNESNNKKNTKNNSEMNSESKILMKLRKLRYKAFSQ